MPTMPPQHYVQVLLQWMNPKQTDITYLMVARAKPATGGEVHGALSSCGGVQQSEVSCTVHPGAANNDVMGLAIGRHQGEDLPCALQPDACPAYIARNW